MARTSGSIQEKDLIDYLKESFNSTFSNSFLIAVKGVFGKAHNLAGFGNIA